MKRNPLIHGLRRFAGVLCLLALWPAAIPAVAGYRLVRAPSPQDAMAVRIYQLDNGLMVYLTEHHEEPRFAAEIAVRAGSKHDPAESTGLAHYLEHLLFKGSQRMGTLDHEQERPHLERIDALYERLFPEKDPSRRAEIYAEINRETQLSARFAIPNEMDRLYKAMGESGLNAHTWHEETVYTVSLPANRLEQWALIESDRFLHPVFRLFQPELEIVYEEKNRMLDNKDAILSFAVDKLLFKRHPYGQQTTIGEVEHLKNPSLLNVRRYYDTHYVPNNMGIFLSGSLDARRTLRLIDRHFSAWERQPLPEPKGWQEDPLEGVERVTVQYKGEEMVRLAFRLPGRNHADTDALKLIDMILDNATAGLINLNLNQRQRVRRAGSGPQFHNDHGAEYLWGIPKQGQTLQEVEQLLLEQLDLLKAGQFEDWILPAIVAEFSKSRKLLLESNESRVGWMRDAFIGFEDWDHALTEIDRLARLTKADIVRVANRHFGNRYVAGYRVDAQPEVPHIEKPPIDPIPIDARRESAFARDILARSVRPITPVFVRPGRDFQKKALSDGVELYYCHNPVNDLFALSLAVEVGTRHDNRLGAALQFLDKSGTTRFDAQELKKEWYRLGSDFSAGAGDNETVIGLSGLDAQLDASVALMVEVLRDPAADTATLEEELKQILLVQREDTKKDFRAIAGALALFNRYGTNSPFLTALPNPALQELRADELHRLVRGLLDYRFTVTYTGSLPRETVEALLLKRLPLVAAVKRPPAYRFLRAENPGTNRIWFTHKEQAQAQVRIEFPDGEVQEAAFPAVQLFNDYFGGGMSGIVFQELREARALAYAVGATYGMGGRKGEENLMTGGIGTQADKTVDALQAFLELFDEFPASPERFAATKDSVLNAYRTSKLGFRDVLGAVRAWERLGLPVDPRRSRFQKVQKADLTLVTAFHQNHLRHRTKLISIVGDRSRIDWPALEKLGEVREIPISDLFAF